MKSMNARQSKVAEQIAHLVAQALVQARIPSSLPIQRFTVISAWVSADLRQSRIYVQMPENANKNEMLAEANLQLSAGLRKHLAQHLGTKYTPSVELFPAEAVD